jgi:hypothetical protein
MKKKSKKKIFNFLFTLFIEYSQKSIYNSKPSTQPNTSSLAQTTQFPLNAFQFKIFEFGLNFFIASTLPEIQLLQ